MEKQKIVDVHFGEVGTKVVPQTIQCQKCGSFNTVVKPTSKGGSKLICNNCYNKVKSFGLLKYIALGVAFITIVVSFLIF